VDRRSLGDAPAIRGGPHRDPLDVVQPGGGFEQVRQGTWIDYTYVVDGVTFAARDFRQWIVVPDHRPKVCYAPSDPADHLLVNGRIVCGRDAGP